MSHGCFDRTLGTAASGHLNFDDEDGAFSIQDNNDR